ncbi:MAG: hypothetical protein HY902_16420 [Deltaproteobacteria bacterium]|nr:hypothetical protein [Deltaproteobacteria bacterium]
MSKAPKVRIVALPRVTLAVVRYGAALALLAAVVGVAAWAVRAPAEPASGGLHGKVHITFKGANKADAAGVVLYLTGFAEPAPARAAELAQRDKRFSSALVPITAGQSVDFPNLDPVFHNVFSPSPVRPFDLGQYRQGESKTKQFPSPGVVDVYCNIHPDMAATILVLPNRRWATSASDGSFESSGIPPGTWSLFAYSRFADKPVRQAVTIQGGKVTELDLTLEEVRNAVPHMNKYGQPYRGEGYR